MSTETVYVHPDLLMNEGELAFFRQYQHHNVSTLSLQIRPDASQKKVLQQISSRQKIQQKLPSFYQNEAIHYPPQLSLEQCSSEATASFKSSLFSGETMIDLTAGMGVDAYYFSLNFGQVIMVEADEMLADTTSHNLALLSAQSNIVIAKGLNAALFLQSYSGRADLIYIDPARRNEKGGKVFRLQDCEPDLLELLPRMFTISDHILIKTSPLLDISLACKSLQHVKNVYVTEYNRECKELLFELQRDHTDDYCIHAVNLDKKTNFSFYAQQEKQLKITCHVPEKFLYEPYACLLKGGGFNSISDQLQVKKLNPHTHLYTSAEIVHDFPGRIFEIVQIVKPSKEAISGAVSDKRAHLTVRNFPATVAELRKKWGITEGGDQYLFATTLCNDEKMILICKKATASK
jgi:hypothetical protein